MHWRRVLRVLALGIRFLEVSDVVCPNETELALLCKGDIDPSSDKSVHTGARELIARGT